MKPPMASTLWPLLLLLVLFLLSFNPGASDTSYDGLVRCLSKRVLPPSQVSKIVYQPTNSSFTTVLNAYVRNLRFNTSTTPKPLIIVTPLVESHVSAAVVCARALGLHIKIRSGGHDYEGISYVSDDPFIILDMFNLRSIDVNIQDESAWVQAGATLGELYYRIWEKSKVYAYPAGICPTVGVGGHVSGGGYGNLLRKYGLAVDNLLDARIVDARGRILDRRSMGEDLFWAISGGGGASFGVVLAYRVKLVPVPETVTVFRVEMYLDEKVNTTDMVYKWQMVAPSTDVDLFMRMLIQPVSSRVQKGKKTIRASVLAEFLGPADRLVPILDKELPELGLKKESCMEMSWIQSVLWWANFDNSTAPTVLLDRAPASLNFLKRKSDYVQNPISKADLQGLWNKLISLGKSGLVFNAYGGRMSEIAATATPFPHRAGNLYKIQHSINWSEKGTDAEKNYLSQIREAYRYMEPLVSSNPRSAFLNYRDLDIGVTTNGNGNDSYAQGLVYGLKYFNGNFDRLVRIKTAVDPTNFFRNEQSIPVKL
ncbi:hypothetical protein SAY87_003435 [Trapa incisa]|uniref:FAD-binding PCMH-type domain-containing protein n=2 Tax=Trapa TaxID=22665 RepID=A0AAN7QVK0_TRANT|nr:hypothetical protein SAY87_003435 [Trapa incisa]KAK4778486.1 hypothetical protein SAY86_006014 [Trapa natans]